MTDRLIAFLGDRPERPTAKHLLDFYHQGQQDREWARMAKDHNWLPITADRGQTNRGEKLPKIFRELELVHVCLSAKVHDLPVRDKVIAIAACWLEIVDVWRSRRGCMHSLRFQDGRRGFKLVDVDSARGRSEV